MSLLLDVFTIVRSIGGMLFVPTLTIVLSLFVVASGLLRQPRAVTFFMWLWCRLVLRYFGIRVIATGFEKLPDQGGAVLAFNHQSNFDIPALTGSTLKTVRYGAKIELFRVPFFGQALKVSGCLPIARDNRSEVLRIYREAAVRFREGTMFALAPEGTRQREPVIGPFKKGPFIFAASSGVPVYPIVIEGADRVQQKGSLIVNRGCLTRTIRIACLDPLKATQPPPEVGISPPSEVIEDLQERTRLAILSKYQAMQAEARAAR